MESLSNYDAWKLASPPEPEGCPYCVQDCVECSDGEECGCDEILE